jgi:hypothetical protein
MWTKRTNLVSQTEFFLAQLHAPTDALRDAEALVIELTSELKTYSS